MIDCDGNCGRWTDRPQVPLAKTTSHYLYEESNSFSFRRHATSYNWYYFLLLNFNCCASAISAAAAATAAAVVSAVNTGLLIWVTVTFLTTAIEREEKSKEHAHTISLYYTLSYVCEYIIHKVCLSLVFLW